MKIKKHVLAFGLVAGLAGVTGAGATETMRLQTQTHAGYAAAKLVKDKSGVNTDGAGQAMAQGGGAAAGGLAAAWLGAKIGGKIGAVIGGPVGLIAGAALGAA